MDDTALLRLYVNGKGQIGSYRIVTGDVKYSIGTKVSNIVITV